MPGSGVPIATFCDRASTIPAPAIVFSNGASAGRAAGAATGTGRAPVITV
jgi:hypothetical protein